MQRGLAPSEQEAPGIICVEVVSLPWVCAGSLGVLSDFSGYFLCQSKSCDESDSDLNIFQRGRLENGEIEMFSYSF